MSPSPRELPVHWIHRATSIPGVFVSWCGHRVWKRGPRYPGTPRPIGMFGDPCPREVSCRKCRRAAGIVLTLRPERIPAALKKYRETAE